VSSRAGNPWTPEEDAELRRLAGTMAPEAIGRRLNRSAEAVKKRASVVGVRVGLRGAGSLWTQEEDDALGDGVDRGLSWAEIADGLDGRSPAGCEARARYLKLCKKPVRGYHPPNGKEAMRKCHDCGRVTSDYRCPKCWEKLRKEYADEI